MQTTRCHQNQTVGIWHQCGLASRKNSVSQMTVKDEWLEHLTEKMNGWNDVGVWWNFLKSLPNPNCCSRRIPINSKLSMFTTKWIRPAWSQMQLIRRHPWSWWTILFQSRAPIFSKLANKKKTVLIQSSHSLHGQCSVDEIHKDKTQTPRGYFAAILVHKLQ